jgi:hypothetical protein
MRVGFFLGTGQKLSAQEMATKVGTFMLDAIRQGTQAGILNGSAPKKRQLSPEAIEKIRKAQRARWAKVRREAKK